MFEDTEENKLVYTDIFKEYIKTLESYIETVEPNYNTEPPIKSKRVQDSRVLQAFKG